MKIKFGTTTAKDLAALRAQSKTWPEIAELFRKPVVRNITTEKYLSLTPRGRAPSKNTGLFLGGETSTGHRGSADLINRTIVNLDLDDHADHIWDEFTLTGEISALSGYAYLVHSTRSHSPKQAKFRIYLPLKAAVLPEEYEPLARGIAELLDEDMRAVARESFTPAQGMYFPSVSSDQDYVFGTVDGDFFDPRPLLKKYPADDASTWPKKVNEKVSEYVAGRKMTHPEEKKAQAPIIAAVHRAFTPYEFIEEFLTDVYESAGERYGIIGATGAPSVRVYDNAYVQSDHGSDRAVGQHNTFDLGRIHLFGHLDDEYETDSLSPVEWPSFKAMSAYMLENPEVAAHLAEVEAEVDAEKNQGLLDFLDDLDDDDEDHVDDLIGSADDNDDLIGEVTEKAEPTKLEVLRRVRRLIEKSKTIESLEAKLLKIREWTMAEFEDGYRERAAADVQKKYKEFGENITKAMARKMLSPTADGLRARLEDEKPPSWIEDWVFLSSENKFFNLLTKQMLSRDGFNGLLSPECGQTLGKTKSLLPLYLPADAAINLYNVAKPYDTRYHPGQEPLFDVDGVLYANSYRAAHVPSGEYRGKDGVKLLKRMLVDLFPEKQHQEIVLDFMAHCIRSPEKKLKYALLIKGSENEGKSLIGNLMQQLLGKSNYSSITNKQLSEKFNGWSHEKLFCTIEEIKMPGKEAYEVLNTIKPVITNPFVAIRRMNKDTSLEQNFCNLYLTTNHEDCLPLEEDNSRFCVLFTRFRTNKEVLEWHAQLIEKEGKIYTRDLWDHVEQRPAQFLEFFDKYEFSEHFDAEGRAPFTSFKVIMSEDSKSEERVLLEEMLESEEVPTITSDVLVWSDFRAILDEKGWAPKLRNRAVASFLKPLGFINAKPTTIWVDGGVRKLRVWTRNLELIDRKSENQLTYEGRKIAKKAVSSLEDLDDGEDLRTNVIEMKRKK